MDMEQELAQIAFTEFGKPGVYHAPGGDVPCQIILDAGMIEGLERLQKQTFIDVLISEVGAYNADAEFTYTPTGQRYVIRQLAEDDDYVRRLAVARTD